MFISDSECGNSTVCVKQRVLGLHGLKGIDRFDVDTYTILVFGRPPKMPKVQVVRVLLFAPFHSWLRLALATCDAPDPVDDVLIVEGGVSSPKGSAPTLIRPKRCHTEEEVSVPVGSDGQGPPGVSLRMNDFNLTTWNGKSRMTITDRASIPPAVVTASGTDDGVSGFEVRIVVGTLSQAMDADRGGLHVVRVGPVTVSGASPPADVTLKIKESWLWV